MLSELKEKVYRANLELVKHNLVIFTWGNVSAYDRESGIVVIKPSGVAYDEMSPDDMVVVDAKSGRTVGGHLNPSSDTPTHLRLYEAFSKVNAIVHTHATFSTAWAQTCRDIPTLGTTHADHFFGSIPCTRMLTQDEVQGDYELATGDFIVERFRDIDYMGVPGVLVAGHGPFAWGDSPSKAVYNAVVLEEVSRMAYYSRTLGFTGDLPDYIIKKHYNRKHGKDAYYGQNKQ